MNRAQRRLAERVERRDAPSINREIEKAYRQGAQDMTRYASKWTYAALILALQRTEHFGQKRLYRVLQEAERIMSPGSGYLASEELIDEIWRKTGLKINWEDPFDTIEQVEKT